MNQKDKKYPGVFRLFLTFLKFGCFTFGGGFSIIAQMQEEYIEKQKCITNEELLDLTSVGRSLPGVMISNVAMLFGYRCAGVAGGIACVLGMAIPPFLILAVVTKFYSVFKDNEWVQSAMYGVRAAVVPIIAVAAQGLINGSFKYKSCLVVFAATLAVYLLFDVNCVLLIVGGAIFGVVVSAIKARKGGKPNDIS